MTREFLFWYHCFSNILYPNTISLRVRASKHEFRVNTNIQPITSTTIRVFLKTYYKQKFDHLKRLERLNSQCLLHLTSFLSARREYTGHSKHPLPTTQEKTLHMDMNIWPTLKSDWLYSLQPKMEKLYTVSKNKTRSWLLLRSWTPYCQIQT